MRRIVPKLYEVRYHFETAGCCGRKVKKGASQLALIPAESEGEAETKLREKARKAHIDQVQEVQKR